jgi:hypothetical protein
MRSDFDVPQTLVELGVDAGKVEMIAAAIFNNACDGTFDGF